MNSMIGAGLSAERGDPPRLAAASIGHGLVSIFWLLLYEQFEADATVFGAFTSQSRTLRARLSR
jgi:hypothetical protein